MQTVITAPGLAEGASEAGGLAALTRSHRIGALAQRCLDLGGMVDIELDPETVGHEAGGEPGQIHPLEAPVAQRQRAGSGEHHDARRRGLDHGLRRRGRGRFQRRRCGRRRM